MRSNTFEATEREVETSFPTIKCSIRGMPSKHITRSVRNLPKIQNCTLTPGLFSATWPQVEGLQPAPSAPTDSNTAGHVDFKAGPSGNSALRFGWQSCTPPGPNSTHRITHLPAGNCHSAVSLFHGQISCMIYRIYSFETDNSWSLGCCTGHPSSFMQANQEVKSGFWNVEKALEPFLSLALCLEKDLAGPCLQSALEPAATRPGSKLAGTMAESGATEFCRLSCLHDSSWS